MPAHPSFSPSTVDYHDELAYDLGVRMCRGTRTPGAFKVATLPIFRAHRQISSKIANGVK
jgi:hypothetical protein